MNKHLRLIYLLLLLLSLTNYSVKAQTDYGSEEEFKKQAAKLFNEEEFEKAYPLYTQLVSLYKKEPTYNYRLGVCMLYADSDKEKGIPYLEFALRAPDDVDKEAYFYLAKAYHLTYRFDDAIAKYKAYKKIASSAKAERFQVDRQIEMCDNAKKLLLTISDLSVIDKVEMNREDFFRAYDISGIGGKVLVKPDEKEFRTSLDKKKKESSILYRSPSSNEIYFSSYGDNENHGKDIYRIKKTASGEWGKPEPLGSNINTKYDEDFPFVHPNGKVMYFCSKGHNSMGGYDVFKSILNETTKEWGPPENMDFPINTPDDDIFYLTDKDEKQAYFSSGRSSIARKVNVYHINVERKSIDYVLIKGSVIKNHNNQSLNLKITVKNISDNNNIIGLFNTKAENGTYDIKLPNNGGKFMFTVESPDFATQSEVVEVPVQNKFSPLKQEISYDKVSDKLMINSLFKDAPSDSSYLLVINLIKEKSKLDVGSVVEPTSTDVSTTEPVSIDTTATATTATVDKTPKTNPDLSNEDIVRIAYKDAKEADAEAKELREQADIALSFANQKNELSQAKFKEANDLKAASDKTEDSAKKRALAEQSANAIKEAEELSEETVAAFNLAKKIDATAASKQEEADLSQQYAEGVEAATKSNNSKEAVAKLDELEKRIDALNKANSENIPIVNSFKRDEENKKRELDKAVKVSSDLKADIADNNTIIAGLKADVEKEKNDQIKEGLNNQIAGIQQENIDKQKQYENNEVKITQLQKEYANVKSESDLVNNVVSESKLSTPETASAKAAAVDKNKLEQQVNTIKTTNANETNTTVATTTNTTDVKTNTTTPENNATVASVDTTNKAVISNQPDIDASDIQISYASPAAEAQVTQADSLDGQADELLAKSIAYRAESDNKLSGKAKKEKRKESEKLVEEAKTKKEQAEQLYASANRTEFTNTQNELTQNSKLTSGSTSGDVFKAELLADEAKKYFDKGQEERVKAAKAENYIDKEKALAVAKDNEKIALQKQKEAAAIYKANVPTVASTNTALENNPDNVTKNASTTSKTNEEVLVPINQKYEEKLTVSDKVMDEELRETAKAGVYKNWANEIDQDIIKQKQDMEAEPNAEKKAVLSRRIEQSQALSAEKQALATQCLAKADALKQKNAVAVITPDNAVNTTNEVNNTNNATTTIPDNTANNVVSNNINVPENTTNTEAITTPVDNNEDAQVVEYSNPAAAQQIEQANVLTDEADDLLAQSIIPQLETTDKNDKTTPEQRKQKSQELINKALSKKSEASKLYETANLTEYTAKQGELAQLAKATSGNNAGDLLKAELLNDDAQKHFNLAADERKKAAQIPGYYEREMVLNDASENEQIALQKQKEAITIYKNYTPATATEPTDVVAKNTTTENVTATNHPDNAANTVNVTTTPVTTSTPDKQFIYNNSTAMEQSVKAASLNKQADDLMSLSLELKAQAAAQSNGDAKNTIYAQSEELTKEAQDKRMDAAQLVATANADEYASNDGELKKLSKASANNNSGELLKAELLTDEAQASYTKAKAKRKEAETSASYYAKEKLLNEAAADEIAALEKQKEATAIYKKYNPDFVSTKLPTNTKNNVKSNVSSEIVLAANESFEAKNTPVYSANNPIPIDAKLPSGLIFKVQIGAFRKPIPQNLFTGMAPITGERTAQGYIRYTAGIFTKFATADKVKAKIKGMGYPDAFVVAFLNGKRIPINEAYALAEGTPSTVLQVNKTPDNTDVVVTTTKTVETAQNDVIKSQSLSSVGGMFYTVQVGVFAKPIPASKLYSMSPLFSETTPSGFTRYYTGIYKSVAKANEAKNIVVDIGLRDAFVTAYYDGKRISVPQAEQHEATGDATFPTGPEVNKLPTFKAVSKNAPVRNTTPTATQPANGTNEAAQQLNTIASKNTSTEDGITYKVQIGAFFEEVPLDMANKFLRIAKKGISNYKDNSGLTVYTVGNCKTYDDAIRLRDEVVAESLTDAFIVAYRDGEKISVDDAKQSK